MRTIPNGQNNPRLVAVDRFLSLLAGGHFSTMCIQIDKAIPLVPCNSAPRVGVVYFGFSIRVHHLRLAGHSISQPSHVQSVLCSFYD